MKIRTRRAFVFVTVIAVAIIFGILVSVCWNIYDEFKFINEYHEYASKYSEQYDIPVEIIFSVIKVESHFRATAESSSGAMGLMQMMPETFEWLTSERHLGESLQVSALYDPEVNIRYGVYYLRYLKDKFDDWDTVFAAYNAGEGNVAGWLTDERYSSDGKTLSHIPIEETENYVKKIRRELDTYRKIFGK